MQQVDEQHPPLVPLFVSARDVPKPHGLGGPARKMHVVIVPILGLVSQTQARSPQPLRSTRQHLGNRAKTRQALIWRGREFPCLSFDSFLVMSLFSRAFPYIPVPAPSLPS